jgi:hypothetical protein
MNIGRPAPGTDEDGLKALLFHQLVDRHRFSDDDIGLNPDAERFDVLDLLSTTALFGRRNSGIP